MIVIAPAFLKFFVTFFGFLQLVIHNTNDNLQRAEKLYSCPSFDWAQVQLALEK